MLNYLHNLRGAVQTEYGSFIQSGYLYNVLTRLRPNINIAFVADPQNNMIQRIFHDLNSSDIGSGFGRNKHEKFYIIRKDLDEPTGLKKFFDLVGADAATPETEQPLNKKLLLELLHHINPSATREELEGLIESCEDVDHLEAVRAGWRPTRSGILEDDIEVLRKSMARDNLPPRDMKRLDKSIRVLERKQRRQMVR